MKRHRPPHTVRNGCGLLAVAAWTGADPATYVPLVLRRQGKSKFRGTRTSDEQILLNKEGIPTDVKITDRKRLCSYLPLNGCGVIDVRMGHHYHALAYDGKMVYDVNTKDRWMWVYDHPWANSFVRMDIRIKEAA
jgi:hypothetical protein